MTADLAAIEQLWHSHHARLLHFISYHVHDYEDARDLHSSVYLRAVAAAASGHGATSHASGWIFAIARNAITDYWRSRQRRLQVVEYDTLGEWCAEEDTHRAAMQGIVGEKVHAAIDKLSAYQEDAIHLRLAGYSYDEIGEAMHTNDGAAKQVCTRAYANLRTRLEELRHDR